MKQRKLLTALFICVLVLSVGYFNIAFAQEEAVVPDNIAEATTVEETREPPRAEGIDLDQRGDKALEETDTLDQSREDSNVLDKAVENQQTSELSEDRDQANLEEELKTAPVEQAEKEKAKYNGEGENIPDKIAEDLIKEDEDGETLEVESEEHVLDASKETDSKDPKGIDEVDELSEDEESLDLSEEELEDKRPEDLFYWLSNQIEKIKNEDLENNPIDLWDGEYLFTETIAIDKESDISLYNPRKEGEDNAAIFKRADGFSGSFFTISNGKLTIGKENQGYRIDDKEAIHFNKTRKPYDKNPNNDISLPDYLIREGQVIYDGFTVNKNKITKKGSYSQNNIIFDGEGEGEEGRVVSSPMINVYSKGELILNGGEFTNSVMEARDTGTINIYGGEMTLNSGKIHHNKTTSGSNLSINGAGGIYVGRSGKLTMNGGEISYNIGDTGGVIVALGNVNSSKNSKSQFFMNGGTIEHNSNSDSIYARGGGVLTEGAAEFIMSGGTISNNTSLRGGGVAADSQFIKQTDGISLVITDDNNGKKEEQKQYHDKFPGRFIMLGGEIIDNTADGTDNLSGAGGGIWVNTDRVHLYQGLISGNTAGNMGGGLYVTQTPLHLVVKDAIITNNKAKRSVFGSTPFIAQYAPGYGGGLWECPEGITHIFMEKGVFNYQNIAEKAGDDFKTLKKAKSFSINGKNVSSTFYVKLNRFDKFENYIKYYQDIASNRYRDGKDTELYNNLEPTNEALNLAFSYTNDTLTKLEGKNSDNFLIISDNIAAKGGGIGSNANVIFGQPGPFNLEIEKRWFRENDIYPYENYDQEVEVEIYVDKKLYDTVKLNEDNDGKVVIYDFPFDPDKHEIKLKEKPLDGWETIIESELIGPHIQISKKWDDDRKLVKYFPRETFYRDILEKYYLYKNNWADELDTNIIFNYTLIDKNGKKIKNAKSDFRAGDVHYTKIRHRWYENWVSYLELDQLFSEEQLRDLKISDIQYYLPNDSVSDNHRAPDFFSDQRNPISFPVRDEDGKIIEPIEYETIDNSIDYFLNYDNIFNFYLVEQEDGSYQLQIPKLGPDVYIDNEILINPFKAEKKDVPTIKYTVNNFKPFDIHVDKRFSGFKDGELPEELKIYLTYDGKIVKDSKGNPRFVKLNEENGWSSSFKNIYKNGHKKYLFGLLEESGNYYSTTSKVYTDKNFNIKYNDDYDYADVPVTVIYKPSKDSSKNEYHILFDGNFNDFYGNLELNIDLPIIEYIDDVITSISDKRNHDIKDIIDLEDYSNVIVIENNRYHYKWASSYDKNFWNMYNFYISDFTDSNGKELDKDLFNIVKRGEKVTKMVINNTMPRTDIEVEKTWKNDLEQEVKVYLARRFEDRIERVKDKDGKDIFITLNSGNDFKGIFKDLPLVDTEGKKIHYTLDEEFIYHNYPKYDKNSTDNYIVKTENGETFYLGAGSEWYISGEKSFSVQDHIAKLNELNDTEYEFGEFKFSFTDNQKSPKFNDLGYPSWYIIDYEITEDGKVNYILPVGLVITGEEDHNVVNLPASDLVITKEVISEHPEDLERLFHFLVDLDHEAIDETRPFKIVKGLFEDYSFEDIDLDEIDNFEDWFIDELLELKDGEYIRIINIPLETEYQVTEVDGDDFVVTSEGEIGRITAGENLVKFINEKPEEPDEPDEPDNPPETPDEPDEPDKPDEPDEPDEPDDEEYTKPHKPEVDEPEEPEEITKPEPPKVKRPEPKKTPKRDERRAPQTGDVDIYGYLGLITMAIVGTYILQKRKTA